MANYKKMYSKLFNTITDIIQLLQSAQAETEKMFIEQEDPNIYILDNPDESE